MQLPCFQLPIIAALETQEQLFALFFTLPSETCVDQINEKCLAFLFSCVIMPKI